MNTENSQETKKESYTGQRIGLVAVLLLAIVIWWNWPSSDKVDTVSFASVEVDNKHAWLMDYRNSDMAFELNNQMKEALRAKVNSPEITISNDCCLVSSASVVAPGRGEMESIGTIAAINENGTMQNYRYKVNFILTDETQEIVSLKVLKN